MTDSLSPGFLVAAPSLQCPFFGRTVVFLADHGPEGSFGFVLNKEADVDFQRVLTLLEIDDADRASDLDVPVLQGGPVAPGTGWMLFDPRQVTEVPEGTVHVDEAIALTASLDMVRWLATGEQTVERSIMLLGYSGWGPGQLESEMKEGSWIPVDTDPVLLFETPLDARWSAAMHLAGINPARMLGRTVAQA